MLQEYYVDIARKNAAQRTVQRSGIETRQQALALCYSVRRKILNIFGPMPVRTPLCAETRGEINRKEYRIEKIIYQSRPGLLVTANLYLPKAPGKHPAVLGVCGHSEAGKAEPAYQSFAQGLVKKGYVVLVLDPLSQGERDQFVLENNDPMKPGLCCPQHNMMGKQLHLVNDFLGTWRAWDGIRGLDYLLSRPEADQTRVGVTGNSGGGTMTTFLNALDSRFTMAAPGCFVTTYLRNVENEEPQDSEQIPPALFRHGLDMADFFIARAPRPVILLSQQNDFFDPRGTVETFKEIQKIYALLGKKENIQLFIGPRGHGYFIENREAMYRFFNTHAHISGNAKEPSIRLEKARNLLCLKSGRLAERKSKRVLDFIREKASELRNNRKPCGHARLAGQIASLLRIGPLLKTVPNYRLLKNLRLKDLGLHMGRYAVETEPGIQCVLKVLDPEEIHCLPAGCEAKLLIPHISIEKDLKENIFPIQPDRERVFAFDPRGIGESLPLSCDFSPFFSPYGCDYFYASLGLMLDQPYLGRKVHDVLVCLRLLHSTGYCRIHLMGNGIGALVAAFAAALADHATRISLFHAPLSYHEWTQTSIVQWPFSHMVRGVLNQFDLPDVYTLLAKKQLRIVHPWNARMEPWQKNLCFKHARKLGIHMFLSQK